MKALAAPADMLPFRFFAVLVGVTVTGDGSGRDPGTFSGTVPATASGTVPGPDEESEEAEKQAAVGGGRAARIVGTRV